MDDTGQKQVALLTFRLGDETYGLEIPKVREVLKYSKITKMPKTDPEVCGVINLRGGVVTVVDLGQKFGMPKNDDPQNANIIIVELSLGGKKFVIGALVDIVEAVLEIDRAQIEECPRIGMSVSTELVKGIGKSDATFIIILDIDKAFTEDELVQKQSQTSEAAETVS